MANSKNKYDKYTMECIRQRMGLEKGDTSRDNEINSMSEDDVFDSVLEWNGIIGYGYMIRSLVEDVYKVTLGDRR